MKKLVGGILVIMGLAAGFVCAAYWSGIQAEHWYQEAMTEGAKNPNVKLSTVRYERGLFSSQAVTQVQFALPEGESQEADPSFSIRQDIYHGPLPLTSRGVPGLPMQWGGAVIRATLDPTSSAWTRELAKRYGDQEPLVAISRVGFDGASDTQITIPPLTLSNTEDVQSLKFSGLQAQFRVAPRGAAMQGNLTVASLDLVGKPTASEDQSAANKGKPASGIGHIRLDDLSLNLNQRKGAFDLLYGDYSFRIGELRAQDQASGAPLAVNNLTIAGTLSPQGTQQVAGEVEVKVDQITVNQQSQSGSLKLALRNLDGVTVTQLQELQQKLAIQPEDPRMLDELMKLFRTLLRGKPEFALDSQAKLILTVPTPSPQPASTQREGTGESATHAAEVPPEREGSEGTQLIQGEWQGSLTLNFQDPGEVNPLVDPSGLLGALEKGVADVVASRKLIEALLTTTTQEQLLAQAKEQGQPVDPQAIERLAAQQVAQQLQGLTAAGFLRLEGDQYKTSARFEGGKLLVNGQEIPLAPGPGKSGSMF